MTIEQSDLLQMGRNLAYLSIAIFSGQFLFFIHRVLAGEAIPGCHQCRNHCAGDCAVPVSYSQMVLNRVTAPDLNRLKPETVQLTEPSN